MKIEIGKSYRNQKGEKVIIKEYVSHPFVDTEGCLYKEDGTFGSGFPSRYNLVSEWIDPVTVECVIDKNDYDLIYLKGPIRPVLQSFLGKKTKVTIEVIE